jgi:hypothetical protein
LLVVLTFASALAATPASAGLFHPKPAACSFGKDGSSGSTFGSVKQGSLELAFQQGEGKLYASEGFSASGVRGFDASAICPGGGYPLLAGFDPLTTPELGEVAPVAVDNTSLASKGNVYLANINLKRLEGFDKNGKELPGSPIPSVSEADGQNHNWLAVAVDPSGNVWAADTQGVIYEFSPAGVELEDRIDFKALTGASKISSLAFDADDDLYVSSNKGIFKLAAPGHSVAAQVDPQSDQAAITIDRASGDLYVAHENAIDRYDSAGNLIEQFPAAVPGELLSGVAVDEATKAVYTGEREANVYQVHVFEALTLPDVNTAALSNLASSEVTLNGAVDPEGLALTGCEFEWVTEAAFLASGFASAKEAECNPAFGSIPASGQTAVSAHISALTEGVRYRFRLSASNLNGTNSSKSTSFALGQPGVETVGSPIRSATTARLDSRVDPHGIATEYSFEYLTEAAYQANIAAGEPPFAGALATTPHPAGSGPLIELVSQQVGELAPATTYRYRVVADNGAFGGAATGEAMTVKTRSPEEEHLTHGPFPGPPGSDRAWEQVSIPDSGGNPVSRAYAVSSEGDAALYQVLGGTPVSEVGSTFDNLFARRPAGEHPEAKPCKAPLSSVLCGWQTEPVFPARSEGLFGNWQEPGGDDSLSTVIEPDGEGRVGSPVALWRIPTAGGSPTKLYQSPPGAGAFPMIASDDASRVLFVLEGKHLDPEHESPEGVPQLYDVGSGTPRMASLLPGNVAPTCGVALGQGSVNILARSTHWLSAEGSRLFFPSCGHLYMRDFDSEATVPIDGPPLAGPDCGGAMIRSNAKAVYLWTLSDLAEPDTPPGSCGGPEPPGGDVYRYDIASHGFQCLTCVVPGGLAANVSAVGGVEGGAEAIALAPDGSRLYFTTKSHLLPGAPEAGTPAIYRVSTETHQLAYVGPLGPGEHVGEDPANGTAISGPDGNFLAFRSADPALDALTGSDNNGSAQYYLYDDAERSLLCVSCPPGGGAPRGAVPPALTPPPGPGPNITPLSKEGDFAFATPTPLVGADQNTAPAGQDAIAGKDVYEWRDGRALLVSDGLTSWQGEAAAPKVQTIDPSGQDLFFTEAAQLTPDALDGYTRLYDARIGGGIEFPETAKPCALEVCQGTPKGAPEEAPAGTSAFAGAGNVHEGHKRHKKHKNKHKHKHKNKHHNGGGKRR